MYIRVPINTYVNSVKTMTFKLCRIYVIIGFAVHFVTAQDPCAIAITIGDGQGSVDNELEESATPICDVSRVTAAWMNNANPSIQIMHSVHKLSTSKVKNQCSTSQVCDTVPGSWYRFDAPTGGQMAEGCVDFLHCGTIYPASLKTVGSHPTTVNQVVTAQVCVNDGDNCCNETHSIDIKMCNDDGTDYYVYQLAVLNGCDSAYCAGTGKPCPTGQVYVKERSVCEDHQVAKTTKKQNPYPTPPISMAATSIQGILTIAITFVLVAIARVF